VRCRYKIRDRIGTEVSATSRRLRRQERGGTARSGARHGHRFPAARTSSSGLDAARPALCRARGAPPTPCRHTDPRSLVFRTRPQRAPVDFIELTRWRSRFRHPVEREQLGPEIFEAFGEENSEPFTTEGSEPGPASEARLTPKDSEQKNRVTNLGQLFAIDHVGRHYVGHTNSVLMALSKCSVH